MQNHVLFTNDKFIDYKGLISGKTARHIEASLAHFEEAFVCTLQRKLLG
jgi:hypothetical protein